MARLDDLNWLLEIVRSSIEESDPEKRAPLVAQMRAVSAEIDSLSAGDVGERNGLIDFQQELAKRRQPAS